MRKLCVAALGYMAALALSLYLVPHESLPVLAIFCAFLHAFGQLAQRLLPAFRRVFHQKCAVYARLACAFLALGLGWSWCFETLFVRPADALVGQEHPATAILLDHPVSYGRYDRLTVRLDSPELPRAKVYVYDYTHSLSNAEPGDRISGDLRFFSAMESRAEDTDTYRANGIFVRASLQGEGTVTGRWKGRFLLWPKALGPLIRQQVARFFPPDTVPFLTALLMGDRQAIDEQPEVYIPLQTAGLTHVISVSGMHVAFLLGVVQFLTGRRKVMAAVGIPLLLLFMLMVGLTPSVLRAGIMGTLLLLAPLARRENDPPTTLAAAALIILIPDPQSLAGVSFQLSFAAMAGILFLSGPIFRWLMGRSGNGLRRALASVLAGTLGAMVFTVPLTAVHFGQISLYSPISNTLCLWAVSAAFLGGYAVCLLGLIWPWAAGLLAQGLALLPRFMFAVSSFLTRLPYAELFTADKAVVWWLVGVYALFFLSWLLRPERKLRPVLPLCLSVISLLILFIFRSVSVPEGELHLAAVDVGQGQSLVALQDNSAVVIDCGSSSDFDAATRTVEHLAANGHSQIDLLVLTHLHADHVNGVAELMERLPVRRLAMPRNADDAGYTAAILAGAERHGTEVWYIDSDTLITMDQLSLTLIAPLGSSDANERGLMVLGRYRDYDFLVTGDADMGTETVLTQLYDLPELELLVVGHHGSRYSTGTELLDETRPAEAVISVGYNNYGHPHETVLQRLEQYGIPLRRTDEEGTVILQTGSDEYGEKG